VKYLIIGATGNADALIDIWRAVREGRMATVSDGVREVTGRNPIPFARSAAENATAFQ
jgi:hypothetical protein